MILAVIQSRGRQPLEAAAGPAYAVRKVADRGPMLTLAGGDPVPPDGLTHTVSWAGAAGATRVVLDPPEGSAPAGRVRVTPYPSYEEIGSVGVESDGPHRYIPNPEGKPFRRLTLRGLRKAGEDEPVFTSRQDLAGQPALNGRLLRLVVSTRARSGEQWIPLFSLPEVPGRGVLPAQLLGASFSGEVLSFPYPLPGQIRLSLVENDAPEDFAPVEAAITSVAGQAEHAPTELELEGPAGNALWGMPGPFLVGSAPAETDVRLPLEAALQQALDEGRPLEATLTLRGAEHSSVEFAFRPPTGALLRERPGVTRLVLAGEPVRLDPGPPLAAETPATATAGLYVRYDGLRLLPELSDPVPASGGGVAGRVIGGAAAAHLLPPSALDGRDVARIGVIGRAPEACELEVQLVHRHGDRLGAPMGPPGRIAVAPAAALAAAWVELPPREVTTGAAAVTVRARSGRFYWADGPHGGLRLVVRDPDPAPRPLLVNGEPLATVGKEGLEAPGRSLPPAAFSGAAPRFDSELFLTVDVTDLTLRYPR